MDSPPTAAAADTTAAPPGTLSPAREHGARRRRPDAPTTPRESR